MSLQTSTLVALSMLLVMGGCATPEEYAQAEANHMSSLRALCEGYGYAPGSEAFARCVQTTNERQQAAYAEQWRRNQCLIDRNCPDMMPKATSAPQYTNCIRDMTGGLHCVTQ